jgi:hypothetical protein
MAATAEDLRNRFQEAERWVREIETLISDRR